MNKIYISLITVTFLGCVSTTTPTLTPIAGYKHLESITHDGFAKDKNEILKLNGKVVKIWGYLDLDNVSTCGLKSWYFSLKSDKNLEAGKSIHINTPAEYSFAPIYNSIRQMQKTQQQRAVLIKGTLHTFEAPTNFSTLKGVEIDVNSPEDITFK
jgi:hypothetical protein